MTYALIDNATLTAAQRIMGTAITKSKNSVDIDLVAFENLVQAILFYDELIAIDDYIPQHKQNRAAAFPFIQFLDIETYKLQPIADQAQKISSEIKPEIRGGEFANEDFKKLFKHLKTHIICTWDISSSVYYLTLKCLAEQNSEDFEKYGALATSIFAELADAKEAGKRPSQKVNLVDQYDKPIYEGYKVPKAKWGDGTTGGTTNAIHAFIASLNWLANRSIFYSLSAQFLKADTFLYPIKQAYQQHYVSKTCGYGENYTKNIVNELSRTLSRDIINIHQGGISASTATDLPIFSAWLAQQTGDPTEILRAAEQLKNEPLIKGLREQFRELKRVFDEEGLKSANEIVHRLMRDIQKASSEVRAKYRIQTRQGVAITRLIQVYNTVAALTGMPSIPEFDFKIKVPSFINNLRPDKGFSALYRNVSADLSAVWALGEARDILGSKVRIDHDAIVYNPKSESPQYRHAHSQYKSPM